MSIAYPLSLPSGHRAPSRVVMRTNSVVGMSKSPFTGSQQVYQWPGEWWSAEVTLPPMARSDAEYWVAFLVALRGVTGTFLIGDPSSPSPQGSGLGGPLVFGSSQTGTQLTTSGWSASQSNLLSPGDYLQVGPSESVPLPRLYKALTPVDSDGSGHAVIDIFPRLRESPGSGDAITIHSAVGTFRLAKNTSEWDVDAAKVYGIAFSALEAI